MKKMNCFNSVADIMVAQSSYLIDKYFFLSIIYNRDGKRKSITEIVEIRQRMIASKFVKEKLDEFIDVAVNRKPYSVESIKMKLSN